MAKTILYAFCGEDRAGQFTVRTNMKINITPFRQVPEGDEDFPRYEITFEEGDFIDIGADMLEVLRAVYAGYRRHATGTFAVPNEDLPEEMHIEETDDNFEQFFTQERNDYILDEILWATDWYTNPPDYGTWSEESAAQEDADRKRAQRGLELMGKYLPALWT